MLAFIVRRFFATILVLLAASFIVYFLTAISGDPLLELRGSSDPNAQEKIAYLTRVLDLDTPPALRYFKWLAGVAGCFIGQCDLGIAVSRGEQAVTEALAGAMVSTIQLVTLATIVAIVLGVAIGMSTALRQYSGYDYTVTFMTFVFYSLPIFWFAVLLKEWGAIRFNQFLGNPEVPIWLAVIIAIGSGAAWMGIVGGSSKTRAKVLGIATAATFFGLQALLLTGWFEKPSLGLLGILLGGMLVSIIVIALTTGFKQRGMLLAAAAVVVFWLAVWYPLQFLFFFIPELWTLVALVALAIAVAIIAGTLFGGEDKRQIIRAAGIISILTLGFVIVDRVLQTWADYELMIPQAQGIISTIGAKTPNLPGDMWFQMLDSFGHLLLPTIALSIGSLAAYTRYARSSLLEVLNQDYVRTARAKGLPERTVIMRHAFRNAMIPIVTIVAFDVGGLIGGAIITERIFAWQGMGSLFNLGLQAVDLNLVMGVFLVTGIVAVVFNVVADIAYAALDPRIRLN
jgi:peptide/nickel transport system permease protein